MSKRNLWAGWLLPVLFAFAIPADSAASDHVLAGAELPLATAHLALLAPALHEAEAIAAGAAQEIPEQEPEPRPQPFPAPPEQPPAERIPEEPEGLPADQPPAEETEIEVEIPAVATELPPIEDAEPEAEADSDTVWYADPFWILIALVFVVVILILIFSGRRRT
ncbi:MAG TPA: hypothetical protein VMR44_06355 [Thermoanaerobaculia bacterium]|nr:hypothetical protein [Thermoanaerobaculia bacterium]